MDFFRSPAPESSSSSTAGVADNAQLFYLDEANLLQNLSVRFEADAIYTYTGTVLLAVNPYKPIDGLYAPELMDAYRGRALGVQPPRLSQLTPTLNVTFAKRRVRACMDLDSFPANAWGSGVPLEFLFVRSESHGHAQQAQLHQPCRSSTCATCEWQSWPHTMQCMCSR